MSDDELDPFIDANGEERRCGSLALPPGFVSAFPDYSSKVVPYNDATIKRLIRNPNRRPGNVRWDKRWIVNQYSKGSCNGWLAAQLLHRKRWIRGIQDGLILSGAYVYSKINGGRDRGSMLEDGMHAICEIGAPPDAMVPWDKIYPSLYPKTADTEAAKHKGFEPLRVTTKQQLRTALAQQEPVGIAIQAGRNYETFNKKGICGIDNGPGNHAVIVDDLVEIDGVEYMGQPGSWGLNHWINGYAYMPLEIIDQTIGIHAFYMLGSTAEAA